MKCEEGPSSVRTEAVFERRGACCEDTTSCLWHPPVLRHPWPILGIVWHILLKPSPRFLVLLKLIPKLRILLYNEVKRDGGRLYPIHDFEDFRMAFNEPLLGESAVFELMNVLLDTDN